MLFSSSMPPTPRGPAPFSVDAAAAGAATNVASGVPKSVDLVAPRLAKVAFWYSYIGFSNWSRSAAPAGSPPPFFWFLMRTTAKMMPTRRTRLPRTALTMVAVLFCSASRGGAVVAAELPSALLLVALELLSEELPPAAAPDVSGVIDGAPAVGPVASSLAGCTPSFVGVVVVDAALVAVSPETTAAAVGVGVVTADGVVVVVDVVVVFVVRVVMVVLVVGVVVDLVVVVVGDLELVAVEIGVIVSVA